MATVKYKVMFGFNWSCTKDERNEFKSRVTQVLPVYEGTNGNPVFVTKNLSKWVGLKNLKGQKGPKTC